MNLESLFEDSTEVILEATDTKGAVEYLQNAFNKAGLTIAVKGSGSTIKCTGSLNRVKFAFTIALVNGKLNADFSGMNIDAMISPPSLKIGKDFRGGVQKFIVSADNAIAEIRTAKTFLMRLTRVLERVTVVVQKNKVAESREDDLATLKNLRLSLSELQNPNSGRWAGDRPKGAELKARIEDRKEKIAALEKKLGVNVTESKATIWTNQAPNDLTFSGVKEWFDDNHRESDDENTKVTLVKIPGEMDVTELTDHLKSIAQPGIIKAARAKNRVWVLAGILE